MHIARILPAALVLAGTSLIVTTPAAAMGHRGDASQIAALRDGGSSTAGDAAPEIGGEVATGAIALVAGAMLLLRARDRR